MVKFEPVKLEIMLLHYLYPFRCPLFEGISMLVLLPVGTVSLVNWVDWYVLGGGVVVVGHVGGSVVVGSGTKRRETKKFDS